MCLGGRPSFFPAVVLALFLVGLGGMPHCLGLPQIAQELVINEPVPCSREVGAVEGSGQARGRQRAVLKVLQERFPGVQGAQLHRCGSNSATAALGSGTAMAATCTVGLKSHGRSASTMKGQKRNLSEHVHELCASIALQGAATSALRYGPALGRWGALNPHVTLHGTNSTSMSCRASKEVLHQVTGRKVQSEPRAAAPAARGGAGGYPWPGPCPEGTSRSHLLPL